MTNDIDLLDSAVSKRFQKIEAAFPIGWDNPALNIIGCVLSLRRKYDAFVVPRVEQFKANHPEIWSTHDLIECISSFPDPTTFSKVELDYNYERAAKAVLAVTRYLDGMAAQFEGQSQLEQLRKWANWSRPGDYLSLNIPGFGLAGFQYLRMLFGADTAKPDVHIVRFVESALSRPVKPVEALYLLEGLGQKTEVSVRNLDSLIWQAAARGHV